MFAKLCIFFLIAITTIVVGVPLGESTKNGTLISNTCRLGTSYGGEDIAVGATTYDVEPIQVDQFGIYLNDQEIAITTNLHNVSTIVRGYKNGDGNFSSCFKFRGTALITGYLAGFGAS
uniref:Uncharacterized protein n=1 Tax=Rhizophagus irregularis (strain DAOM 181602 / DAOM 197198 / MUCL 43194) TaxID=747089 RepID=U9UTK8_RHIID